MKIRTRRPDSKNKKAGRLLKRHFRVCTCIYTSTSRQSTVLEMLVHDFDAACLQETRTCLNRPLVLRDFMVIQMHECHSMATEVRSDLNKKESSLSLKQWRSSSSKMQGISVGKKHCEGHHQKKKKKHTKKNQQQIIAILINVHMHPTTFTAGARWDSRRCWMVGDTTMRCSDFKDRASSWGGQGAGQQGYALEKHLALANSDMHWRKHLALANSDMHWKSTWRRPAGICTGESTWRWPTVICTGESTWRWPTVICTGKALGADQQGYALEKALGAGQQ